MAKTGKKGGGGGRLPRTIGLVAAVITILGVLCPVWYYVLGDWNITLIFVSKEDVDGPSPFPECPVLLGPVEPGGYTTNSSGAVTARIPTRLRDLDGTIRSPEGRAYRFDTKLNRTDTVYVIEVDVKRDLAGSRGHEHDIVSQ